MKKGWRSRREYWAAQPQPMRPTPRDEQQAPEAQALDQAATKFTNALDAFLAILPKTPDTQD
jgi:hypothetical protein